MPPSSFPLSYYPAYCNYEHPSMVTHTPPDRGAYLTLAQPRSRRTNGATAASPRQKPTRAMAKMASDHRCQDKHCCDMCKRRPSSPGQRPAGMVDTRRHQRYRMLSTAAWTKVVRPCQDKPPAVATRTESVSCRWDDSRPPLPVQVPPAAVAPLQGQRLPARRQDNGRPPPPRRRPPSAVAGIPAIPPLHPLPLV